MLGLTMTPKSPNAMAILSVVRRDHFRPGDGIASRVVFEQELDQSDDVGGFFSTGCVRRRNGECASRHILIKQLLASAGDGVRIQAEELGEHGIAAMSQFDGFQTGEEAALLLVEQAVEEQDGGFEFIGRHLKGGGIGDQRDRLGGLPGAELIACLPAIGGGIQESPGHIGAAQGVLRAPNRGGDLGLRHGAHRPVRRQTSRAESD